MRTFGLLVVASLAVVLLARRLLRSRSEGQLGHASFAWEECLLGCAVTDNPMAAGGANAADRASRSPAATRSTRCAPSNDAVATVASAAPTASTSSCSPCAPGQTQLQLLDAKRQARRRGHRHRHRHRAPRHHQGWAGAAPLVLEGSTQTFHVTTVDANSHTLIGTGAVSFDLAAPLVAAVDAHLWRQRRLLRPRGRRHHHRAYAVGVVGAADHRCPARPRSRA